MYITDNEGNILHDISKALVYTNNIVYSTAPVQMLVNLEVPLNNLLHPGKYNLQLLAKDKVASISSLKKVPFTVVKQRGQVI